DLSVSAFGVGGSMDPFQPTTAQASWTAPTAETITWFISWDQIALNSITFSTDDGQEAPVGGGPPSAIYWTATVDAGTSVTAFASGDGGGADLTAQVVSVNVLAPEPGTFLVIAPCLWLLRRSRKYPRLGSLD